MNPRVFQDLHTALVRVLRIELDNHDQTSDPVVTVSQSRPWPMATCTVRPWTQSDLRPRPRTQSDLRYKTVFQQQTVTGARRFGEVPFSALIGSVVHYITVHSSAVTYSA